MTAITQQIRQAIYEALQTLIEQKDVMLEQIVLEHSADLSHGDYSCNIAMRLAKQSNTNPKELATRIADAIQKKIPEYLSQVQVAGPGFLNFYLSQNFFAESLGEIVKKKEDFGKNTKLMGKKIMVEYTQPNPFKPFHIGHLMSNTIGEFLSRIVAYGGAQVIRANYQGDVGLHVAKALWGMTRGVALELLPARPDTDDVVVLANYIGDAYVCGSTQYEAEDQSSGAKAEIDHINKKVYEHTDADINSMYDWGRAVTLEAFEKLYARLGTKFDHYFFESATAEEGKKIVAEGVSKGIFETSDGAVVFHGEQHDPSLHTRVFITSQGLPAYETKELGLAKKKFEEEKDLDLSITVTAVEQENYMKVVFKALSLLYPEMSSKLLHIVHGMMRFASGKMSSRKGNVITGESLLNDMTDAVAQKMGDHMISDTDREHVINAIAVAAIKYSVLRQSTDNNIVFDSEKALSFEGDSGPYLQYTYARCSSLLEKAWASDFPSSFEEGWMSAMVDGRGGAWETTQVEKLLYRFPEVIENSLDEYAPQYIATYLIDLARAFNSWYGNTKILDEHSSPVETAYKLTITQAVSIVLKNGLGILGIDVVERM